MFKTVSRAITQSDTQVWYLALGETLVWAGLYYSFPAFLLQWEVGEAWSRTELSFAMTTALIASALLAPFAGKFIDRGWGRYVLSFSAVLGGSSLCLMSFVDSFSLFYALWVVIGVAMAGCLYEPCFAFVTHARPRGAKRAITLITLAAGFASTIAFPTASALGSVFDWRTAVLIYGLVVLFVAVPLLWKGTAAAHGFRPTQKVETGRKSALPLHNPSFWLLALSFTSIGLAHGMLISHLMPILDDRGATAQMAVLTAALIGPMQVVGRVLMMSFDHKVSVFFVAGLTYVFMMTAGGILFTFGVFAIGLVAFAMFQGSGYGVTSITKPLVTANVLGRANFGAISGAMAVPYLMAYASAPTLAANIWTQVGYDGVILLCVALPGLGLLAFFMAIQPKMATQI